MEFSDNPIPAERDVAPPVETVGDFNPEYPGSTQEAPYGFKEDGTPYKRRPRASGGGSSGGRGNMPATNGQATQAAALLGRANLLIAMVAGFAGMPATAAKITESNDAFEAMARDALATDPKLCKSILSAGSTSGKAGLAMAYVMLGGSLYATARDEVRELRAAEEEGEEE